MCKATQSVVTKKNPFWIPKNRYYELKYYCLQFWDWQRRRAQLDGLATRENRSPTESEAIERAELDDKIGMVMTCLDAVTTDKDQLTGRMVMHEPLYSVLLTGITKGKSYDTMAASKVMPVSRDYYYMVYRRFFKVLDIARK